MLGQDVVRAANAVGFTRAQLDVTDRDAVRAAIGPGRRGDQLRRLDRRGRRRGARGRGAADQRATARATSPRPPARSCTCRATTSSTAPSASPYLESDPVDPLSAYGRTKLAGERATAAANPRHFIVALLLAVRRRRARTSSRRCSGSGPRCAWWTTRSAAPPSPATWPRRSCALADSEDFGIHHVGRRRLVLVVRVRPRDLRPRRLGHPRGALHHRGVPAARAASRLLGARQRARPPPADLAGGPRRLPAGCAYEAARHRRRRLHRLHLRPARQGRARRGGARQAHLRRPAREPARRTSSWWWARSRTATWCCELTEGVDAIVNFAAESHVDRSIADQNAFARTHVIGTSVLLDAVRERGVARYLQVSTDEVYGSIEDGVVHRELAARPVVALLGHQGRRRPARVGLRAHLRRRGGDLPRLEQLRSAPVPREADPAVRPQRAARRPAARLRRRAPGAQLALRRGLLPRHPRRARGRPAGRGLQRRRARRVREHRGGAGASSS